MIQIARRFVPAADEVWRLQQGSDPECVFFQRMAEHGHYGGRPGQTRQGIYVCSPGGAFLASINSNDPDRVLATLERGLKAWEELPVEEKRLAPHSAIRPRHRWEDSFPKDGLVLSMITRDLPADCDPSKPCAAKWNQDRAWFSKAEARQWLAPEPKLGDRHPVPQEQVSRLARLHLVDTVNGQTSPFAPGQVTGSQIATEVVERKGGRVTVKITGTTKGDAPGRGRRSSAHGVETQILGHATYDLGKGAFVEFQMVALGTRWGYTELNGRRRDPEAGPVGFVFELAPADAPPIAPAFVRDYDVPWVRRPERR
ncbi:MAG TPA: hypothetical protein VGF55_12150 [Gemmataceae bacterium]